jgi:proteasome lid subunit RPN8/RPN11
MIYLSKEHFEEIIKHCQTEYPNEACGILAGKEGKIEKVYKMTNVSETPQLCYFMNPQEQLKVFKEIRQLGIEMVAIYHSHSKTDAYPSKKDCELAFYHEVSYVIISLKNFHQPNIRAFKIVDNDIKEEEIIVK